MGFQSRSALLLAVVSAIVMAIFTVPVSAEFESYFKPVASLENPLSVDFSKYLDVWGDEVAAAASTANLGGRKLLQYGESCHSPRRDTVSIRFSTTCRGTRIAERRPTDNGMEAGRQRSFAEFGTFSASHDS